MDGPAQLGGSLTFTVQRGHPLAGHRANRMCQPSSPAPHTSYRPQLRPLGSCRSHPTPPACVLPRCPLRPVSVTASPSQGRWLRKGQICVTVLPGKGDTGTWEAASGCSQPAPSLSPSQGRQRRGSPTAPRCLGACSHGAREWRELAVPSLPVLLPSLPAFFSFFFFPLNTSPRNAQGGGSTISHCEHLSLYCSARQNTVCPANKHPFICRPQHWGIQGRCQHRTGLRQPLGPARPPLVIGPQCWDGAHCSRRLIRTMVNFMPPPPQVSDAGMLFPSFGAPVGCARGVLYPIGLTLPCEKTSERLPHRHFGAGMLLGAKQDHTMGLCSGLPYLLPPPGSISKGGGSFSQRKHKTSSICPRHQGTQ